jgi:transcriptional regulator with XRE-family HTH domain
VATGHFTEGAPVALLPASPQELGAALRTMRGVSLDNLLSGTSVPVSKSQLGRYERGVSLPPLKLARDLDRLYEAEGWIEVAVRSLWRRKWDPWRRGEVIPKRIHALQWPAAYEGIIWLKIIPTPAEVGRRHDIGLAWGPWRYDSHIYLDAAGVLLVTGKARDDDGATVVMNLDTDPGTFLLHGAGEDFSGERVIDIRQAWRRR